MAQKAQVDIIIDSKSATKNLQDLNNEINQTNEVSKSLKAQLRELTAELANLEPGTDRFNELSVAAGQLRDQINDANEAVAATAGNVGENLAGAFVNIGSVGISAFQGIASAQALFGAESEDLQKVLVKLQALAGLGDALKSLAGLDGILSQVKAQFAAATAGSQLFNKATVAQAVATGNATVAQRIMNAVMSANPIFLIIGAVTALVGAYAYFSDSTEDAAKAQEDLNKQMERNLEIVQAMTESTNELIAATNRDTERRIAQLKIQGATQEEIFKAEQEGLELSIRLQKNAVDVAQREYDKAFNNRKVKSEELAKFEKALNDARNKETELRFQLEMKQLDREVDAAQKAAEKKKQAAEKYAADRKAALERIRLAEQEYADSQLDDQERELTLNKRKYDELLALAKKYGIDSTKLIEAYKNEQNNINVKYAQKEIEIEEEKQARLKKAIDDAQQQALDDQEKFDEEYRQATQTELQNDIDAVNERYFYLIETAKQYGYDTTELEKKRLEEIKKLNDDASKAVSQKWVEKATVIVDTVANVVSQFTSLLDQIFQESADRAASERETRYNAEVENYNALLANQTISREAYDAKIAELDQIRATEELNARRKAFRQQKALNIVNAVMSTAQAVLQALAGFPPPASYVMAAINGALGAAQIGVISAQQFKAAKGGVVPGSPSMIDSVPSLLAPGEMVINSQSSSMFPELLSAINQAGGGISLAPNTPSPGTGMARNTVYNENKMEYVRAIVVENEVTDKQKRVSRIERAAKFT